MFSNITPIQEAEGDPPVPPEVFLSPENISQAIPFNNNRQATIEEIKTACAECQAYNGGEGFFARQWDDRVWELLVPSYKLLCLVGNDAVRLGIAISQSGLKTTKATLKNEALICVNITAQPHDTAQRKLCSSWAQILNEARSVPVSVEGFAVWVKTRSKQQSSSPAARKCTEPSGTASTNQLKLRLTGSDGPVDEILALPPLVHAELLDVLTTPCPQSERVQRVAKSLMALADQLKAAEERATVPSPLASEPDASLASPEVADV
ncbi:hypothetical protein [Methylobacterium sp. WL116]|uniref:hypothetical protein n=1 Tax=Methylobacterium sp. WL116 TaxID=2603889 RepID=UPI0011C990CD|nr:hypothetical protein [Methylobacterium sp. WL116]TXM94968.1 hypothetical protein FV223_02535 [Methylobacterium sp. WL116]